MHAITRMLPTGVLFLAMTSAGLAQTAAIQWHQDLAAAQKLAAESNRLVLVHFWAPWCAPCIRLDQQVFNQGVVAQAMQSSFVPVKINADKDRALAEHFGLSGLPADIVLTPAGQLVARLRCPPTADAYAAQIAQVAAQRLAASNGSVVHDPRRGVAAGSIPSPVATTTVEGRRSFPGAAEFGSPYGTAMGAAPPPMNNPYVGLSDPARMGAPQTTHLTASPTVGPRYRPAAGVPHHVAGQAASGGLAPRQPNAVGPAGAGYGATSAWPQQSVGGTAQPSSADRYTAAPPPPVGRVGSPVAAPGSADSRYPITSPPLRPGNVAPGVQPAQQWRPSPQRRDAAATQWPSAAAGQMSADSPPSSNPLGMEGYCPVTLKKKQVWLPGDRRWGVNHRGRTYLFANAEAQREFIADPDTFSPVLSGVDPVMAIDQGRTVNGERRHGVFYDNQVYLFSSENSLQRFSRNPKRYATGIRQALQTSASRIGPR